MLQIQICSKAIERYIYFKREKFLFLLAPLKIKNKNRLSSTSFGNRSILLYVFCFFFLGALEILFNLKFCSITLLLLKDCNYFYSFYSGLLNLRICVFLQSSNSLRISSGLVFQNPHAHILFPPFFPSRTSRMCSLEFLTLSSKILKPCFDHLFSICLSMYPKF